MSMFPFLHSFHRWVILIFLLRSFDASAQVQILYVQGDVVNIRSTASTSGSVVAKASRFEQLTVLRRDKAEVLNGVEDYWYNVRTNSGKEGYVFGHFTSLKREGQKSAELILDTVMMGDCYHIIFGDLDFGAGLNDLGAYEAIAEDESNPNPRFIGKRFRIIYNDLFAMQSMNCDSSYPMELVKVPTIVRLELLD